MRISLPHKPCHYHFIRRRQACVLLFSLLAVTSGCTERGAKTGSDASRAERAASCDAQAVREVLERFGSRLKQVPLSAPDSVVREAIRSAYAPFVTVELLDAWIAQPSRAPGRAVSSPWPERIEVTMVRPEAPGICRIEGEVVYVTSVEVARGGAAYRERVVLRVEESEGPRISAYEVVAGASPDSTSASAAVDMIRRYYAAIDARDFRHAYELWGGDGEASGQSFERFAGGFSETARVEVELGPPGRMGAAAGSRYVSVPVVVRAVTKGGEPQRFEGTYTLRHSVVDGASAKQRRWHIYSASIRRAR
jgi:hypothetical protein